jgi:4-diphosphocytidyl-2-C-methyl-D-erythritol kinase
VIYRCVETFPPAKLNLFLEVLGKRSDGYHELETIMMAVELRDAMRIQSTPEPHVTLRCQWMPSGRAWERRLGIRRPLEASDSLKVAEIPRPEDNLVTKALSQFKSVFSIHGGFQVELNKHIPAGAGMGGASSDAASALLAAAKLCNIAPNDRQIFEIASKLGSDIPFFLGISDAHQANLVEDRNAFRAALAKGRGERLSSLQTAGPHFFVIVYPPHPLSTADVFRNCAPATKAKSSEDCAKAIAAKAGLSNRLAKNLFNRLTEPAREISRWIDETFHAMQLAGLEGVTMTGSGSACFATAPSPSAARRAANRLASRGIGACFAVRSTPIPAPIRFLT